MAKILSVYNRLQAGDYENGNGGKRRVSRLTQFMHATLQLLGGRLCMSAVLCLSKTLVKYDTWWGQVDHVPPGVDPATRSTRCGSNL